VRETVLEPAFFAQANQGRLGEISRDSYLFLLVVIAQAGDFGVWARGHLG